MEQRDTDRLAELFEHALTLSQEDRRRYACDACGDDTELCSELLSLLAAHDEAPGYLERLAHQLQPAALAPTHSFEPSVPTESGLRIEGVFVSASDSGTTKSDASSVKEGWAMSGRPRTWQLDAMSR